MSWYEFLPKILNMSFTASVVIVAVLLIRLLLKKSPKIFSYALWAVVLFRLLCPVSFTFSVSLLGALSTPVSETGRVEYIPPDIVHMENPAVDLPIPGVNEVINNAMPQGQEQLVADPLKFPMTLMTYIWALGILAMLISSAVQLIRLRRRLIGSMPLCKNIYLVDYIDSPFVTGLIKPKIYLPSSLQPSEQRYIIMHEKHHISRGDHIIKLLAYIALCVHWFNPLVWLAFFLSSKDMEMSCDEAVMKKLSADIRADYSTSLLRFATGRKIVSTTPLAFGEGDTKDRVKNVMKYKKPVFWVIILAIAVLIAAIVLLASNPKQTNEAPDVTEPPLSEPDDSGKPPVSEPGADGPRELTDAAARMENITAEELIYVSAFRENFTKQTLAEAMRNAAPHDFMTDSFLWTFWDITIYMTDDYSSNSEHFNFSAGLEENVVRCLYFDGEENYECYFEAPELYNIIRNTYSVEKHVDMTVFPEFEDIIDERAKMHIESSKEFATGGMQAFTDYDLLSFEHIDTFTEGLGENEAYEVYNFTLAFRIADPTKAMWAGGMYLDSEARVGAYEQEPYFVVHRIGGEVTEYNFFFWDLYNGAGDEAERQRAFDTIHARFNEE